MHTWAGRRPATSLQTQREPVTIEWQMFAMLINCRAPLTNIIVSILKFREKENIVINYLPACATHIVYTTTSRGTSTHQVNTYTHIYSTTYVNSNRRQDEHETGGRAAAESVKLNLASRRRDRLRKIGISWCCWRCGWGYWVSKNGRHRDAYQWAASLNLRVRIKIRWWCAAWQSRPRVLKWVCWWLTSNWKRFLVC